MYELTTEFFDIYNAYKKTAKGKRKKNEVIKYENNLHMQLCYLKKRLELGQFSISGYHRFMIYDPKEREIQALSFADRVFQHLLCDNVIKQYFEPRLIYDNAACREGKGTHFAMDRLSLFLREHYREHGADGYILKFDIKKYFNSIDHEVLKAKLKCFPNEDVKKLLFDIIDSYEFTEGKGLPMGNQTSQWFALYYLDRLDRYIKEKLRIKHYVRYMDDGIIVHKDKEFLKEALRQMTELVNEDRLEFNAKTQIFPISQGADFLGFRFYLTDTGKVIRRVRTSNKKRFKRRLKLLKKQVNEYKLSSKDAMISITSYLAHLKHGNTWKLRKKILKEAVFTHARKNTEWDRYFEELRRCSEQEEAVVSGEWSVTSGQKLVDSDKETVISD